MIKKRVRCPYCASLRTKKKGKQGGRQRYGCNECGKRFQRKFTSTKIQKDIWNAYVRKKQTLEELTDTYGKSHVWIRKQLDSIEVSPAGLEPQPTVLLADTTFWGKRYGVMVFRSWTLRQNIWWSEVGTEKVSTITMGAIYWKNVVGCSLPR